MTDQSGGDLLNCLKKLEKIVEIDILSGGMWDSLKELN